MTTQVSCRLAPADQVREMTVETNAFVVSATIFRYYEGVVFTISRAGGLRWQRSRWACPHGEERGERYGDYR